MDRITKAPIGRLAALIAAIAALGGALPAAAVAGGMVTVTTTADHNDGTCDPSDCTLREAVALAAAGDTINLPAGTYRVSPDLQIADGVSIVGAGARTTTISGGHGNRVLTVTGGTSVITGVTITAGNGSSASNDGVGGGIWIDSGATLTLDRSEVSGNTAPNSGGGIDVNGELNLTASTVSGNTVTGTPGIGGGIDDFGSGVTLTNSTISGNTAAQRGGGVFSDGTLTTVNATIAGNTATAADGGGLAYDGTLQTIDTIVAGNSAASGANCSGTGGTLTDNGHNLAGDGSCGFVATGDKQSVDPLLGPLQDNLGPTDTRALGAGSPAIDAGDPLVCLPTDQRGVARPQGPACDIGAYEAEVSGGLPPPPAVVSPPSIPGGPKLWDDVQADHGTWSNSPTSYSYQWEMCDATGGSCSDVAFATGADRIMTRQFTGHTARVRVVAHNNYGDSAPATSAATPVIYGAPQAKITSIGPSARSASIGVSVDPAGAATSVSATVTASDGSTGTVSPVSVPAGAAATVTLQVTGLLPATGYHVHLNATNSYGSAPLPEDPCCVDQDVTTTKDGDVTTAPPQNVTAYSAQLVGIFDPVFFTEVATQDCAGGSGNGFGNCGLQAACIAWNANCFPYFIAYKQADFEIRYKTGQPLTAVVPATSATPLGGSIPGSAGQGGQDPITGLFMDYAAFTGYGTPVRLKPATAYEYRAHYFASCIPQSYGSCDPPGPSGLQGKNLYGDWRSFTTSSVDPSTSGTLTSGAILVSLGCVTASGCAGTGTLQTIVNLPGNGPVSQGPATSVHARAAAARNTAKPITLGSVRFTIKAHHRATIHVPLSKTARAYVRKHRHDRFLFTVAVGYRHKQIRTSSVLRLR